MTITTDQINQIYRSLDISEDSLKKYDSLLHSIMKSDLLKRIVHLLPPEIILKETFFSNSMPVCNCVISAIIVGMKIGYELAKSEELECQMNK